MNRSIFGVAIKKWRFKMLRNCVLLVMTFITFGQADAGLLPEPPDPQGGDLTGSWVAHKVELNAYIPAALVEAVKPLTVEGEINGTLILGSDGSIQANYKTVANVSALLWVLLTVTVHDTSQYTGNYTVRSDTHELIITRENEDPLNYTYTATADSLHIIRPLLLDELLASLPESVRPLAQSSLSHLVSPDDPIRFVIRFAKSADIGTLNVLTGDFNGNGVVNISDFLLFVNHFETSRGDGRYDARYDLDSNNEIGFSDFLIFVNNFGKEESPSGGMAMIVTIPDENLLAVIENSLDIAEGTPITRGDMVALTSLEAPNENIRDLTGLEFAINLTKLSLYNNSISNITPLAGLNRLEWLVLSSNSISDITPLLGLNRLEWLYLPSNSISDITPLSRLTNLEWLFLYNNSISDITPLSELNRLEGLFLYNNSISDITPLSELNRLRLLDLESNSISNITPLAGLNLLERLSLHSNSISDLAPLVTNTGLGSGDWVYVRNNPLNATSINTHIPALQSRGVSVSFGASKPAVGEQERDIFRSSFREGLGAGPSPPPATSP